MSINPVTIKHYGNFHLLGRCKNKPNSNPIQTQFLSGQNAPSPPILSILNLINVSFIYTFFFYLDFAFGPLFFAEFLFISLFFFSAFYILTPNKNKFSGPVEGFSSEIFKPSLLKLDFVPEIR